MNMNITNQASIIERNIHCPFCDKDEALLLHELTGQKSTFQWPDFGKKYWLRIIFTFGISAIVHGFPFCEIKRAYNHVTYGFCPHCGNSFNASCPETMKKKEPKFYRKKSRKWVLGLFSGVAEYTELPLGLVRLAAILYAVDYWIGQAKASAALLALAGVEYVSGPIGFLIGLSVTVFIGCIIYFIASFLTTMDPDENW